MTDKIKTLVIEYSQPELAERIGMVYQVWEDGEITLQKSGPILWQRTLHCMAPGNPAKAVPLSYFPHRYNNHAYVYVTREHAEKLHNLIMSQPEGEHDA